MLYRLFTLVISLILLAIIVFLIWRAMQPAPIFKISDIISDWRN